MLFNQILNPRLTSPLVRIFGMKTGGNPAPTLAPEVQPTLDINDADPSLAWLRLERLLAFNFSLAAGGAGNWTAVMIRNPANSGALLVIERFLGASAAADVVSATISAAADYTTAGSPSPRDTRWITPAGSYVGTGRASSQITLVASPAGFVHTRSPQNTFLVLEAPVVLSPGWAFVLYPGIANAALSGFVQWRERPLPQEEQQTG